MLIINPFYYMLNLEHTVKGSELMFFELLTVLNAVPEKVHIIIHQDNTSPTWTDILTALGTVGTVVLSIYLLLKERFKGLIIDSYLGELIGGVSTSIYNYWGIRCEIINETNKPVKIKEVGIVRFRILSKWSYKKISAKSFSIDRYSDGKKTINIDKSHLKQDVLNGNFYLALKDATGKIHVSRRPIQKELNT